LTRDRRGTENTFLLHADRPGDRPRLLYWYRTAPGIMLGRSPLDEDAIRTIEDSHPDIEFDWPAILALSEVMTPEDEAPVRPQKKKRPNGPPREPSSRDHSPREHQAREPRRDDAPADVAPEEPADSPGVFAASELEAVDEPEFIPPAHAPQGNRLLEELVGREIASRLRARYAEITARIVEKAGGDASQASAWAKRAEPLNPDLWVTPDAILDGVRAADGLYDSLKAQLS
jgi:hypothetical protein